MRRFFCIFAALLLLFGAARAELPILSAGGSFCLAVTAEGDIWGWGDGRQGQLGNGNNQCVYYPQAGAFGLDGKEIADIQCGNVAALFLMKDGTVWTTGYNNYGQQGSKTAGTHVFKPIQVPGLENIVQVACGFGQCMARTADGHVWIWGRNNLGQAGDASRKNVLSPVLMELENIMDVQCGGKFCLAMDASGDIWGWGENENRQLGDVSRNGNPVRAPIKLPVSGRFVRIACGGSAAYGIDEDGTCWAWGRNDYWQLGRSDAGKYSAQPVRVGLPEGAVVTDIRAYNVCTMVKLDNGEIWQWGGTYEGQLGLGYNAWRTLPMNCTPFEDAVITRMAVSSLCSYLMTEDGRVFAAGYNKYGQTGTDIRNRNDVLTWADNGLNLITGEFMGPTK